MFMRSDGGLTPMEAFSGSRAILSGPAGGVVGYAATTHGWAEGQPVIGFDMGGRHGGGWQSEREGAPHGGKWGCAEALPFPLQTGVLEGPPDSPALAPPSQAPPRT